MKAVKAARCSAVRCANANEKESEVRSAPTCTQLYNLYWYHSFMHNDRERPRGVWLPHRRAKNISLFTVTACHVSLRVTAIRFRRTGLRSRHPSRRRSCAVWRPASRTAGRGRRPPLAAAAPRPARAPAQRGLSSTCRSQQFSCSFMTPQHCPRSWCLPMLVLVRHIGTGSQQQLDDSSVALLHSGLAPLSVARSTAASRTRRSRRAWRGSR